MCFWAGPLLLCGPSVYVSVSQSECFECCVQSHCWGAQMHIQSCVLCSLNSVNPSAVPKLRTQASPVFSPLSRIFTLSHWARSQNTSTLSCSSSTQKSSSRLSAGECCNIHQHISFPLFHKIGLTCFMHFRIKSPLICNNLSIYFSFRMMPWPCNLTHGRAGFEMF